VLSRVERRPSARRGVLEPIAALGAGAAGPVPALIFFWFPTFVVHASRFPRARASSGSGYSGPGVTLALRELSLRRLTWIGGDRDFGQGH
jgi:hypothetical protein